MGFQTGKMANLQGFACAEPPSPTCASLRRERELGLVGSWVAGIRPAGFEVRRLIHSHSSHAETQVSEIWSARLPSAVAPRHFLKLGAELAFVDLADAGFRDGIDEADFGEDGPLVDRSTVDESVEEMEQVPGRDMTGETLPEDDFGVGAFVPFGIGDANDGDLLDGRVLAEGVLQFEG